MRFLLSILLCLVGLPTFAATTWYASTNGSGIGTIGSPFDLQTAFTNASIVAGDTLLLRDGYYVHIPQNTNSPATNDNPGWCFRITFHGSAGNEITVKPFPGERPVLDGLDYVHGAATARPTLQIGSSGNTTLGSYVIVDSLEVMSSSTETRQSTETNSAFWSFPRDLNRSSGIDVFAPGAQVRNCILYDTTTGIQSFGTANSPQTFYWNHIWNQGWNGLEAPHGHGFYLQNTRAGTTKHVDSNMVANVYVNAIQAYGSSSAEVFHFRILGNMFANNRLLVGGRTGAEQGDDQIIGNYLFNAEFGFLYFYSVFSEDIIVANNYIVGAQMQGGAWTNATITNNTVINTTGGKIFDLLTQPFCNVITNWNVGNNHYFAAGTGGNYFTDEGCLNMNFAAWKTHTGYDLTSTLTAPVPITNLIVLEKNIYNTNLAHVMIYNHATSNSVGADLSSLGWSSLDTVRVRNFQDYFGDVTTNTLPGNILTVNMTAAAHTVAIPRGAASPIGAKTFPKCGMFVVERLAGSAPTPTNTITIASSAASGASVTATTDLNGNGTGTTTFTRDYLWSTVINLTAPLTLGTNNFSKWRRAGVDYATTNAISYTVDTNVTLTAVYVAPPVTTWTFNMASSNPASGVVITNSPNDNNGNGTGTTAFSRVYNDGVSVTISAPATSGGNDFQKWQRGGVDYTTARSFSIVANSGNLLVNPQTFTAVYVAPAPPARDLIVNSVLPSSGVPIVVSVTDTNGLKNGTTGFTRSYPQGAVVTLSAPPTVSGGNVFVDWQDSAGASASSGSTNVIVTLDISRTRVALYTNAPLPSINVSDAKSRRRGTRP